jgi:predicted phage tail protein
MVHVAARNRHLLPALLLSLIFLFCSLAGFAQTTTLAAPTLVAPAQAATGVTIPVLLSWNAPGTSSYTYALQVSRNETFTDLAYAPESLTAAMASVSGLALGTRYWWRVRAYTDAGYSPWSTVRYFTTITAAALSPAAPKLLAPSSGSTNLPVNLQFSWNAAARATNYTLQAATNQAFTEGLITRTPVTATLLGVSGLQPGKTYFWRVKAFNASGESAWSAAWTFTTTTTVPAVPTQPRLVAPANGGAAALPVRLQWQAAARATSYSVQVSTNDGFAPLIAGQSSLGGTTLTLTSLPQNARYFWRVCAVNNLGASLWSEVWSFTLGTPTTLRVASPIPISPANGASGVLLTAQFAWKPVDGAQSYSLQLLKGPTSNPTVVTTREGITGTGVAISGLLANTVYLWKIRAISAEGGSVWSAPWGFTTGANAPLLPAAPMLEAPAEGAVNVPTSAQLTWKPAERATSYTIVITTVDAATPREFRQEGLTATAAGLPALAAQTKYAWRARGVNAAGAGPWSAPRLFTTAATPPPAIPTAPTLLIPTNGTVDLAQVVLLKWNAAERATSYAVQVAATPTFNPVAFGNTQLTGTSVEVRDLLAGKHYYWRVKASNASGTSAWSAVWEFSTKGSTTTLQPPQPPTLKFPENAAVNVPLQARLLWTPGEGAVTHIVQYAPNELFTNAVTLPVNQSIAAADVTLNADRTYYWRVRAVNAAGQSAWSTAWRFATVAPAAVETAPTTPVLRAPSTGAVNQGPVVHLTWYPASRAQYYTVQVATQEVFAGTVLTKQGVVETALDTPALRPSTTYYWRVRALNAAGESPWSAARTFTTAAPTADILPVAPTPQAPVAGAKNAATALKLEWSPADRATTYHVQLSTVQSFDPCLVNRDGLMALTFGVGDLATNTTYFWRVRGVNEYGAGPWSAVRYFITAPPPAPVLPDTPVLIAPAAGATAVPTTTRLSWYGAARATGYTVQVSFNDTFTDLTALPYASTAASLEVTGLKPNTLLYWRVRALNAAGESPWSAARTFTTAGSSTPTPTVPATPMLYYPYNGNIVTMQTAMCYWSKPAGAQTFTLQVATSPTFAQLVHNQSNITTTWVYVYDLQTSTRYYWRVRATNATGNSEWSTVWSFITADTFLNLPVSPQLLAPSDGQATTLRPRLTWSKVTGVWGYVVEVATDAQFTQKLISQQLAVATTLQVPPGLVYGRTYYWRVRTYNGYGFSPWGTAQTFTPSPYVF